MQGQKRDKGRDKLVADPHREYLDEDFSDEATEEKSEQDECSANLLRATYEDEELGKLIRDVQELTTLSDLVDEDWNEQCISAIREFFENPRAACLTVYFDGDVLSAQTSFPRVPVDELTYFVRKPLQVFTSLDFKSKVLFGTVNDNVENSILNIVNNVMAPAFTRITDWPDSILSSFFVAIFIRLPIILSVHIKAF
ncbi:hypothetical protein QAD02_002044 [Eretmocerus hayati]|uniref:Uncharacterized protein n=1 Tax=Eretmocerus hayati TaxID=131215 RepID=A0ACC2NMJ4_9HYME|nr:hypothetical protein QAD02_002044 [Eretmocerus hayati]